MGTSRANFQPTSTVPGSEERIRIMEQRLASGQPLFHPDDTKDEITAGIKGFVSRNGVIQKTTDAVDIREKTACEHGCLQPKKFSSLLTIYRKKRGLSLRTLAQRSGISLSTVMRIEHGEIKPALPTMLALLTALRLRLTIEENAIAG